MTDECRGSPTHKHLTRRVQKSEPHEAGFECWFQGSLVFLPWERHFISSTLMGTVNLEGDDILCPGWCLEM